MYYQRCAPVITRTPRQAKGPALITGFRKLARPDRYGAYFTVVQIACWCPTRPLPRCTPARWQYCRTPSVGKRLLL
jgi:hypothetical protein